MTTAFRKQPYRLDWNKPLPEDPKAAIQEMNKRLGTFFTNSDEMFQWLFDNMRKLQILVGQVEGIASTNLSTVASGATRMGPPGWDGLDGEDGESIPGPPGATGAKGDKGDKGDPGEGTGGGGSSVAMPLPIEDEEYYENWFLLQGGGGGSSPAGDYVPYTGADKTVNLNTQGLRAGSVGLGCDPEAGSVAKMAGHSYHVQIAHASSGAAHTIDWSEGNVQKITLDADCTLTFSNAKTGGTYLLQVVQGAGPYEITWPAEVTWPGSVVPRLSDGEDDVDLVAFVYDGTNFIGAINIANEGENPSCSLYLTVNWDPTTGEHAVPWDGENWDNGGMHDPVTNNTRITIPADQGGIYLVDVVGVLPASSGTGGFLWKVKVNGALKAQAMVPSHNTSSLDPTSFSCLVNVTAGQYIEIYNETIYNPQAVVFQSGTTGTQVHVTKIYPASDGASLTWTDQTANTFFAAPNGVTGQPSFRVQVMADLPAALGTWSDSGADGTYFSTATGGVTWVLDLPGDLQTYRYMKIGDSVALVFHAWAATSVVGGTATSLKLLLPASMLAAATQVFPVYTYSDTGGQMLGYGYTIAGSGWINIIRDSAASLTFAASANHTGVSFSTIIEVQ